MNHEAKILRRWICRLRKQLHTLTDEHIRGIVQAKITQLNRQLSAIHSPTGDCNE